MRVLDVSPRIAFPPRMGSSVRTFHLLAGLAREHEIRQFSLGRLDGAYFRERKEEKTAAPAYTQHSRIGGIGSWITELSERSWPQAPILAGARLRLTRPRRLSHLLFWADLTIVEFPWTYAFCRSLRPAGRFILSAHNVESTKFPSYARASGRSGRRDLWVRHIERAERRAVTGCDLVLAVSEDDRTELMRRYAVEASNVVVVPNGADTARLRCFSEKERRQARRDLALPERPTVVFVGSNVAPNRAAMKWVERLAPRLPEFSLLAVGPVAAPGVRGNLVATGPVDDVLPYLRAADFSICPIAHGGGTKIKLLEALACGLPTVAFPESARGLPIRDGIHAAIVPAEESALVQSLQRFGDDRVFAGRMGREAAKLVADRFGWDRIARDLSRELNSRFGPAGSGATPRSPGRERSLR